MHIMFKPRFWVVSLLQVMISPRVWVVSVLQMIFTPRIRLVKGRHALWRGLICAPRGPRSVAHTPVHGPCARAHTAAMVVRPMPGMHGPRAVGRAPPRHSGAGARHSTRVRGVPHVLGA